MPCVGLVNVGFERRVPACPLAPDQLARERDGRVEQHHEVGSRQGELAVLHLLQPVEEAPACGTGELRPLVGCVRRDVAVADDEVVLLERGKETWARVEAVAPVQSSCQLCDCFWLITGWLERSLQVKYRFGHY